MPIYLRHPKHGTKVATAEAEAVYDESNGWERYQLAALLQKPEFAPPAPPPPAEKPKRAYKRRTH